MVVANVINLLEVAIKEDALGEKARLHKVVEKVVHQAASRVAVNEFINMRADNFAELEYLVQHFTSNPTEKQSIIVVITNPVKLYASIAASDEGKFHEQSVTRVK